MTFEDSGDDYDGDYDGDYNGDGDGDELYFQGVILLVLHYWHDTSAQKSCNSQHRLRVSKKNNLKNVQ